MWIIILKYFILDSLLSVKFILPETVTENPPRFGSEAVKEPERLKTIISIFSSLKFRKFSDNHAFISAKHARRASSTSEFHFIGR